MPGLKMISSESVTVGLAGVTHAMATGKFVRRPNVKDAIPAIAAVAVTRSRLTSRVINTTGDMIDQSFLSRTFFANCELWNSVALHLVSEIAFARATSMRNKCGLKLLTKLPPFEFGRRTLTAMM